MNDKNQKEAIDKLSKLKVGALFMEMGTGKTKVALELLASKKSKVQYLLWISPFSLKNEVVAEIKKWHPELLNEIEVVGCETIGQSDRRYMEIRKRVEDNKTFIVVDESLKIKNMEAKRTKRIIELGKMSEYRLILNGTPITRNVTDIWSQMEFLSPKILNMSYRMFKDTYCEYYIRGKLRGLVKKQHNIEHLISKIEPYIFDSRLEIDKNKNYYDYTYKVENRAEYEAIKQEYLQRCAGEVDFFVFTTLLQRYYCKSKTTMLNEIIKQLDEAVIVFVKYLESIPEGAMKITGDVSLEDRKKVIENFRKEKGQLYITYGCGAHGLNLQFCRNIIFAEHCFDYGQRIQAEARIYRIGQEHDVNYYNLWCDVGLEGIIKASLDKKENLLDEIKKEIEKRGQEEWLKSI